MPRRRAVRLSLAAAAAILVLALAATAVGTVLVVREPLPQVAGRVEVPGLGAGVTVSRDERGVPFIEADTSGDLFRAQGYVHAQDRFFEMDYRRHVTAGRLSELVGENEAALEADAVIRTLGWRRVAEQEWELLQPETRENLQAYADGVNAYLDQRDRSALAVEYSILDVRLDLADPEPWTPVDSLAWLKAMAWDLKANYADELARGMAFETIGDVARVDELFPAYPQDVNLPILQASSVQPTATTQQAAAVDLSSSHLQEALASAERALSSVPNLLGEGDGIGSNSWVVSGTHTVSGLPVLANDPHLGISAPGIWTQIGLHCRERSAECPYDVSGFSFAGLPGVVIGHNGALAWGLTNLGADVTDFFLERVSDGTALLDGERVPLSTRREVIKVNGGDDVEITVRSTKHGPIVSDVLDLDALGDVPVPEGSPYGRYEVALAWAALNPGRTADAVFALAQASDADDVAAAAALFEVPSQNIVYATTDGHIGYQAPGRIPVRADVVDSVLPSDGSWPRPGWDSAYDWQGWVPAEQMPAVQDPAEGFIVAANQAVTPAGVGPYLTSDWDYGFRAQRIRSVLEEQIRSGEQIDVATTRSLQADVDNPYARVLLPALLAVDVPDSFDDDGQDLLRTWDMRSDPDSAAAAYFASVWSNLLELTFWDDLPEGYEPTGGARWLEVVRRLLETPDGSWWDDRSTVGVVEGRDEILTRALVAARRELTADLGKDPSDWRWGKVHTAAPEHDVLGSPALPAPVRRLVNPTPREVGGGAALVNATAWDAGSGSFGVTAAPAMRMVVDLADLDSSAWVTMTGASGHPGSVHYADQLTPWAEGRLFPWPFSADAIDEAASDVLELEPGR
ncbi:penicillin acylase family protein [Cellulomonas cellasea]|uniref:Penicillin amidase n=1 Tax=Cellulomonas cellasea TaxID=43670 RepID=A0A7W4YCE8_9CELL|nr:penicillin acylase family protein [Cellulomonas cellasea]MBB2924024.1 penicillin amidase [Cellulomonas cellasea]